MVNGVDASQCHGPTAGEQRGKELKNVIGQLSSTYSIRRVVKLSNRTEEKKFRYGKI